EQLRPARRPGVEAQERRQQRARDLRHLVGIDLRRQVDRPVIRLVGAQRVDRRIGEQDRRDPLRPEAVVVRRALLVGIHLGGGRNRRDGLRGVLGGGGHPERIGIVHGGGAARPSVVAAHVGVGTTGALRGGLLALV